MSKFLTTTFILLAASAAFAIPSYWAAIETEGYQGATKSGSADVNSYAGYYCTVEEAIAKFGGATVTDIEKYLGKSSGNFDEIRGIADKYDSVGYGDGEYSIVDYTDTAFTAKDYIAIAFWNYDAYRVFGEGSAVLTPYGQLTFNDSMAAAGTVGVWNVPEPTSGLLLLLGVAGLALRRRNS